MGEYFNGWRWKIGVVALVVVLALTCNFWTQPNGSSSENSHPSPQVVEPIAKKVRPTDPDGKEIPAIGNAPKEILIGFTIDEHGLATDEQVDAQMRNFSMSEFGGWNKSRGWCIWVGLNHTATLKALRLEESKLQDSSPGFGGHANWKSWRISPSYRLRLTYNDVMRDRTHISFLHPDWR